MEGDRHARRAGRVRSFAVTTGDPVDRLERALDVTGEAVVGVGLDDLDRPTPCVGWDTRTLVAHLVEDVLHFGSSARGEPWQKPEGDVLGDDANRAYREAADSLVSAWRAPGATERTVTLPMGEMPSTWLLGQHLSDVVVHGWDVARATEAEFAVDDDLAEASLEWARTNLPQQFRGDPGAGKPFGGEVPVDAGAPALDRLVAFFGRDPAWSPPADR